jgi:D-alanine-D-alanine ligase
MTASDRPARITVLYNLEGEGAAIDASSVADAATAIADALNAAGFRATTATIAGDDIFEVLSALRADKPDLVFNLCEAMAGDSRNEPTFVGLLDLFGIAYTGADLLGLASCLYKQRAKDILIGRGVATPAHRLIEASTIDEDLGGLEYPQFVKLVHEDASVGITEANVARSEAQLRARSRELIQQYRQPVIAERYIEGREINVTLIGNGAQPRVLPLHEIDFAAMPADRPRIVSYAAKWDENHVDYDGTKPVPLRDASPAMVAAVERTARAAWHALGLRDYGRVDLRVDETGTPWVIDVNPNCDISPDAGVARSAKVAGMTYVQLIELIAMTAWQRIRGAG